MTTKELQNGWIEWNGEEKYPPVEFYKDVEYRTRSGHHSYRSDIGQLDWLHNGSGHDIVAYRMVNPN